MSGTTVRTACPYCGVGCGLRATVESGRLVGVEGDPEHPVNRGRTCAKPVALPDAVHAADRATTPRRRRDPAGPWEDLGWDAAIGWAAERLTAIRDEHGPEAIAFYVSGQLMTEDYYVVNKLAKGFLGTNTVDSNSRLCMSSAVAGYKATFGSDGPLPSYDDLDEADCVLLLGSNAAACHPIVWGRIRDAQARPERPCRVIVVDPRRTATAAAADLHLPVLPGGDVPLLLGMLHVVVRDGLVDEAYLAAHAEGWEGLREQVRGWSLERAARVSGVDAALIEEAARTFATAGAAMTCWTMGANQSTVGTDKNRALHALCVVTGQLGRPGAGPLSLTGQPNAMGGREVGGLATLLPGYRDARDPDDRAAVNAYWRLPPTAAGVSERPGLVATDLVDALHDGRVKAVWIMATNPAVSLPESAKVREALRRAELVVVQDAYHPTETSHLAHLVLPAAQWLEKDGTTTSSERRVTLMRRALPAPGDALPDWQILARLGAAMGWAEQFAWPDAAAVHAELVGLTAGRVCDQSGITHARLRRDGSVRWPFTTADAERADRLRDPLATPSAEDLAAPDRAGHSPRLYPDHRFPTPSGRARLGPLDVSGLAEAPDDDHPLLLTTGRVGGQWHTMTRTGKSADLLAADPEPFVELHPDDARRAGVEDGERVRLVSRRGSAVLRARVPELEPTAGDPALRGGAIRPGVAFAPFHWGLLHAPPGAGQLNALSHDATDPVSRQPELKAMAVRVEALVAPASVAAGPAGEATSPVSATLAPAPETHGRGADDGAAAGEDDAAPAGRRGRRRRERLVLVGGGMAAIAVLESVFAHRPSAHWETTILCGERDAPYDRVRVSKLVSPDPREDIALRPREWYLAHDVDLRLGTRAERLDLDAREVVLEDGERVPYDKVVLCTGSQPATPPILGLDLPGVVPFRTRADAAELNRLVRPGTMATVIGGGLLGLEAAAGLAEHGASVTIVHLGSRLMDRQLDRGGARLLERRIRELGIQLLLEQRTDRIVGTSAVTGVRFAEGDELAADLVVLATGIRPEIRVAMRSGIACHHAIVVDDELRTSAPDVWAVGECAEHRDVTYGLWAPIAAQARAAGATIAGVPAGYQGSPLATTLKVVGVDLFACGRPDQDTDEDDVDEVISVDTRRGTYRRLVLREGRLAGAVLLGDLALAPELTALTADAPAGVGGALVPDELLEAVVGGEPSVRPVPDAQLVCACNQVTAGTIRAAVADGDDSVEAIRASTGASGGCGGCASRVAALLEQARVASTPAG
ncbi:molybdopterin-dependent oxidoreductase [Patulibacter brassicae]|uniref:Molybdopterin-dependent oxidoreductase n=1 Tax=Patulibacter brassicae TaxID=1705717 RepID=A0ABU4VL92_9ACTN|nr:molybdopterin-dependent oxidoreductase [Patulibacter brassicae]MDX8151864.1 molybdopterin-dependent oxidoreductase [Patulibacter brassicae]